MGRFGTEGQGTPLVDRNISNNRHRFTRHQGEIFGWEAFALHDPVKGRTVVIATNACGVGLQMYGFLSSVYPDSGAIESLSVKP